MGQNNESTLMSQEARLSTGLNIEGWDLERQETRAGAIYRVTNQATGKMIWIDDDTRLLRVFLLGLVEGRRNA